MTTIEDAIRQALSSHNASLVSENFGQTVEVYLSGGEVVVYHPLFRPDSDDTRLVSRWPLRVRASTTQEAETLALHWLEGALIMFGDTSLLHGAKTAEGPSVLAAMPTENKS